VQDRRGGRVPSLSSHPIAPPGHEHMFARVSSRAHRASRT
jgi:hypothetical protein